MVAVAMVLAAAVLASCSDAHTDDEKLKAEAGTDPRVITVFQPPELIPAMKALAEAFGRTHPDVAFTYEEVPSTAQRKRVDEGATPSLWIDLAPTIDPYADDPRSQGKPFPFGSDVLQFVVQPGNPKGINAVSVFGPGGGPFPGARTGLCRNDTRCGLTASKLLVREKIDATPTLRYPDGQDLAGAVADNTLDTGLVYRTDAARLGPKLSVVPLEDPSTGQVEYHMLRLTNSTTAADFETFLGTDEAQGILLLYGLLPQIGRPAS